jgi:hypothetical protein
MTSLPAQVMVIEKIGCQYQVIVQISTSAEAAPAHDDSARAENLNPLATNVIAIILAGYSSL